jgi:hypothetical protein
MTEWNPRTPPPPGDRRARLAASLRANLKRRKAQHRLRTEQEEAPHADDGDGKRD